MLGISDLKLQGRPLWIGNMSNLNAMRYCCAPTQYCYCPWSLCDSWNQCTSFLEDCNSIRVSEKQVMEWSFVVRLGNTPSTIPVLLPVFAWACRLHTLFYSCVLVVNCALFRPYWIEGDSPRRCILKHAQYMLDIQSLQVWWLRWFCLRVLF